MCETTKKDLIFSPLKVNRRYAIQLSEKQGWSQRNICHLMKLAGKLS